ncbi:MAG: NAD(P)H-dependent oxidoreductase [Proteobacteria bacterium]|nr:NAD(P)H-dependent oxidoreductase [Pseudomonadota bacterium]
MRILGVSGSLRAASLNSALLRTAVRIAPPGVEVRLLRGIGELPLFNPDLEGQPPAAVIALRAAVDAADALLIASPEYARGVSGLLKNALDWLVSHEGFVGKPVALLNASPRAHHAQAALRETLRTMSALLVEEACAAIPLLGSGLAEAAMAEAPAVTVPLRRSLEALRDAPGASAQGPAFPLP